MLETLVDDLEGIRLNEEQRQFNISELTKENECTNENNDSKMLELCKQYYGKICLFEDIFYSFTSLLLRYIAQDSFFIMLIIDRRYY